MRKLNKGFFIEIQYFYFIRYKIRFVGSFGCGKPKATQINANTNICAFIFKTKQFYFVCNELFDRALKLE